MTRVTVFAVGLVAAVLVAVWFANNPGEVVVQWQGWRLDTSVGILILLMALAVLTMLAIAKIISIVRGTAQGFAASRARRRMAQGLAALGHGFAAAHAGQAQAARRYAKEASALLDDNAATRVLNARAATANDDGATLRNVALGLLENPETELSALRDLTERAYREGDVVGALNYAKRALGRKDAPKWALEMVLDIQIANGRWSDALVTVESKAARVHYTDEAHKKLKTELLTRAAEEALGQKDANGAETSSRKALEAGGGERAIVCHARALMMQGKQKKAASEIEKVWGVNPSLTLLRAYGDTIASESALDQARRIEKLVSGNSEHPESRLALAEASLKAQLWGQARNRLSPLLGDDVPRHFHARAAMLMAELETAERNDAMAGAVWLKRALDKTERTVAITTAPRTVAEMLAAQS